MDGPQEGEVVLGVTAFKPRSLDLIEQVASGKLQRVVLTKRGRPVAALVALDHEPDELSGALADVMEPAPRIDLTKPTGEVWAAQADE